MKNLDNFINQKNELDNLKELGFNVDTTWYHVTNNSFSQFDVEKFNDRCIWLTRDLDSIKNGETGASLNSNDTIIMKCFLKSNINLCGWDEEDRLMEEQMKQEGFQGVLLDNDVKIFDSKNVIILDNKLKQKIIEIKSQNLSNSSKKNNL